MEWRKETEMSMRDYELQLLIFELAYGCYGWMTDTISLPEADTLDEVIEMLSKDCGDNYEVVTCIHLINGQEIELHNHCFDSVTCLNRVFDGYNDTILAYRMDGNSATNLKWDDKGKVLLRPTLDLNYTDKDGHFHQSHLPISMVAYIDCYDIELDWKDLWAKLPNDEKDRRRKMWLEYWKKCKEREERNKNKD